MARPRKADLANGTIFKVPVTKKKIDNSLPCCKELCMLTLSFEAFLKHQFGEANYKIASISNGCKFSLNGRRYEAAFNSATSKNIVRYDDIYKKTGNINMARAAIRPFTARVVVVNNAKLVQPPSKEERKVRNAAAKRKYHEDKAAGIERPKYSGSREISK